jgi:hypothetical protein
MSDYGKTRQIKSTRKEHGCEGCNHKIPGGSPAVYAFGRWDGYTYSYHRHIECAAAQDAFAEEHGMGGEEYPWFNHCELTLEEATPFLLEHHPIVAQRLGLVGPLSEPQGDEAWKSARAPKMKKSDN